MNDIYADIILDHYHSPRNFGSLPRAKLQARGYNPLCGDTIQISATVTSHKIKAIKFQGEGCALSVASASLLTEYAKHKSLSSLSNLEKDFMLQMTGVTVGPTRLKCLLLPLEVLQKSLHTYNG